MAEELNSPSLSDLGLLVGAWDMALSGASFLPDPGAVAHGRVEIRSIEEGRLLAMRQFVEPSGPPAATWVIGRDESQAGYVVLYADNRAVARVYTMTLSERRWRMWRDDPHFSQRFEATIDADGGAIAGRWEKRSSGGPWEHDFNVSYTRLS